MALLHMTATEPIDLGDGVGLTRVAKERLHVLHVNHLLEGQKQMLTSTLFKQRATRWAFPAPCCAWMWQSLRRNVTATWKKLVVVCGMTPRENLLKNFALNRGFLARRQRF